MKKLKLWQKYIAAIAAVDILALATLGSVYAFSQSDLAKGEGHYSSEDLKIRLNEMQDVAKFKITMRDPIDTKKTIGTYSYSGAAGKNGTINGLDAIDFIESYYKKHLQSPVMFINAGGIKFTNFYSEVIYPKDFVKFVLWFSKNISWTPGLSSISSYVIKKGIEKDGNTITLGSYAALKGETKTIKFMPDSFYGVIKFGNLITKLSNAHMTEAEVRDTIKGINETNQNLTEEEKIYPYSAVKQHDGKYLLYMSNGGKEVIDASNKMYSNQVDVGDLDISIADNGNSIVKKRKSMKVLASSDISRLTLIRTFGAKEKWKGLGLNFLKYVTTHEYGHMETLSMTSDGSAKDVVALGPSGNIAPNIAQPSQGTNLKVLNDYFKARIPSLKAYNVSPIPVLVGTKWKYLTFAEATKKYLANQIGSKPIKDDYVNVSFQYTPTSGTALPTMLELEAIFGKFSAPTDKNSILYRHSTNDKDFAANKAAMLAIIESQITTGASTFQFLQRNITDLRAFAKLLKVPLSAITFINANDNLIPTTTPRFNSGQNGVPFGMQLGNVSGSLKWIHDAEFQIKSKDGQNPWFVKTAPKSATIANFVAIPIVSRYTNTTYYINPAAIPAAVDDADKMAYMKKFAKWFKTFVNQDMYNISGNEVMHRSFDMRKATTNPFKFGWSGNIPKSAFGDAVALWKTWNNISDITASQFPTLKNGRNKIDLVSSFTIKNGSDLLWAINSSNSGSKNSGLEIQPGITVINRTRIIPFNSYLLGGSINVLVSPLESINNWLYPAQNVEQKLFDIFKNEDKTSVFKIFDASGNELKSSLDYLESQLDNWENEAKTVIGGAIPQKVLKLISAQKDDATKIAIYRKFILKSLISQATQISINNKFVDASHGIDLSSITFKKVAFEKIFDMMFIELKNSESNDKVVLATHHTHYLYLNNTGLDAFVANIDKLTKKQTDAIKVHGYYHIIYGVKDQVINSANDLEETIKRLIGVGSNSISSRIVGDIRRFVNSNGALDSHLIKDFFDKMNTVDKNSMALGGDNAVKTLRAWQTLMTDNKVLFVPGQYKSDFVRISIQDESVIEKWLNNPFEGFLSTLTGVFTNYTSVLAEVLTRDWVQMTYIPNGGKGAANERYRYGSEFTEIMESSSGIELYINPKSVLSDHSVIRGLFDNPQTYQNNINDTMNKFYDLMKKNHHDAYKTIWTNGMTNFKYEYLYGYKTAKNFRDSMNRALALASLFMEYKSNNGYAKDRWLKDILDNKKVASGTTESVNNDWKIYDDNRNPIIDPTITLKSLVANATTGVATEATITNRPEAYWWWFLRSQGVGNRTVSGLWRVPEKDAFAMWGYLPTAQANRVKYIEATSTSGHQVYIPLNIKGSNNLFYLTKQASNQSADKHKLADDGYSSWNIDMLTAGTWRNSLLTNGDWKLKFVDENKQEVNDPSGKGNLFKLGAKEVITEDNKDLSYAPLVMRKVNGEVVLTVKNQFAT